MTKPRGNRVKRPICNSPFPAVRAFWLLKKTVFPVSALMIQLTWKSPTCAYLNKICLNGNRASGNFGEFHSHVRILKYKVFLCFFAHENMKKRNPESRILYLKS